MVVRCLMVLSVSLIFALSAVAQDTSLQTYLSSGDVSFDLKSEIIRSKGFGAANKSMPKVVWKRAATEAAKADAQVKVLEFLNGLDLRSISVIKNYRYVNGEINKIVKGSLSHSKLVGVPSHPTEDTAEVILEVLVKGGEWIPITE